MTAFLALSSAAAAAITGATALGTGRVLRGRDVAMPKADTRGVRVNTLRWVGKPLDLGGDTMQWDGTVLITVMARGTPDQDAEAAIDDLLGETWSRLAGMTPPAGCNSVTLDPDIRFSVDDADASVATAAFALSITQLTASAALTAA
ncbi:MAG: hypothetical protein KBG45_10045 [Ottowia sp.]|nr:hypothetical protein [Ottowia sp.]